MQGHAIDHHPFWSRVIVTTNHGSRGDTQTRLLEVAEGWNGAEASWIVGINFSHLVLVMPEEGGLAPLPGVDDVEYALDDLEILLYQFARRLGTYSLPGAVSIKGVVTVLGDPIRR